MGGRRYGISLRVFNTVAREISSNDREQHDFDCNLVLISTSKFFKENKIARARRTSVTCSFRKIYKCLFALGLYLHQIVREIMLLLVNNLHEKRIACTRYL